MLRWATVRQLNDAWKSADRHGSRALDMTYITSSNSQQKKVLTKAKCNLWTLFQEGLWRWREGVGGREKDLLRVCPACATNASSSSVCAASLGGCWGSDRLLLSRVKNDVWKQHNCYDTNFPSTASSWNVRELESAQDWCAPTGPHVPSSFQLWQGDSDSFLCCWD